MTESTGTSSEARPLAGRRALVTGASSGIGASTAVALARAGATVGICARRSDRLAEVLDRCREHAPGSRAWTVDLSVLDGIDGFAARAEAELGGIDVLVNNAGVPKRRRTSAMTPDDVESVMAFNYFSPARLTMAVLPGMLARGTGHVVNVSSMGVHLVAYGTGAYGASKAALEMFTEAMYVELAGTGVHAHLFVPGSTRTEFSTPRDGNDPPFPQDPAGVADPDEVAAALVDSLATDDFRTFAMPRDRASAEAKEADVNGFLVAMRARLAAPAPAR
jgi:NAD(P)-dependent dehydrogenase (short-subunit alcohol dehydrogenase family)